MGAFAAIPEKIRSGILEKAGSEEVAVLGAARLCFFEGAAESLAEPRQGENPAPGDFVRALIVDTLEYDLVGQTP